MVTNSGFGAALCLPGIVGSSGIVDNQLSKLILKFSGVPVTMSLIPLGKQLKSLAPLTCREASLAFLTAAGALLQSGANTIRRPLLSFCVKVAL